jgi:hypothetical protein
MREVGQVEPQGSQGPGRARLCLTDDKTILVPAGAALLRLSKQVVVAVTASVNETVELAGSHGNSYIKCQHCLPLDKTNQQPQLLLQQLRPSLQLSQRLAHQWWGAIPAATG